ncbi:MAG: hypothetical protein KDC86_14455, partial [Saprospiraceae bacterium]|nr:hypothetical protein [Saprospiraceae bacterium]
MRSLLHSPRFNESPNSKLSFNKEQRKQRVFMALVFGLFTLAGHAATITWTNGNSTGVWSDPLNWDSSSVPGTSDDVVFDVGSSANCNIDGNYAIRSLTIASDYLGVVSLGSNTLEVSSGLSIAVASGFDAGTGLIKLVGGQTINSAASLFNMEIGMGSGNLNLSDTVYVDNELTITSVNLMYSSSGNGHQIQVKGDVVINDAWGPSGSYYAVVSLVGDTDQSISGSGNASYLDISKTAGDVLLDDDLTLANG